MESFKLGCDMMTFLASSTVEGGGDRDGDLGGGAGGRACDGMAVKETLEIAHNVGHDGGLICDRALECRATNVYLSGG